MHIGSVVLAVWLVIGGIAAGQRGDFGGPSAVAGQVRSRNHPRRSSQLHGRAPEYQLHRAASQQLASAAKPGIFLRLHCVSSTTCKRDLRLSSRTG